MMGQYKIKACIAVLCMLASSTQAARNSRALKQPGAEVDEDVRAAIIKEYLTSNNCTCTADFSKWCGLARTAASCQK